MPEFMPLSPDPILLPESNDSRRTQVLVGSVGAALALLALNAVLHPALPHTGATTLDTSGVLSGLASKLALPGFNFGHSLLAGASAGISRGLSRIVTFPLDTVKTR